MSLRQVFTAALLAGLAGAAAVSPAEAAKNTRVPSEAAQATPGFLVEPAPPWVKAVAAEKPAVPAGAALHYAVLDYQTRVGTGTEERFARVVTAIEQSAGLEAASQVRINFDPSYQTLVLHRIEVQRGTQKLDRLDRRKVRLLQREARLEQQMADGRLTASLVLDDLRVGDRVEVAYSLRGANPVFNGRFVDDAWMLSGDGPAALMQYRLLAPQGRTIRHRIGNPAVEVESRLVGGERETVFRRRALPQFSTEPDAAPTAFLDERLQLSEFTDWTAVAQWAQGLFRSDAAMAPEVKAQAAAIAAQSAVPMERLQRALDFVQGEIRYFGTEMGMGSHRPAAPEVVLRQRHGDCKDKSMLLAVLLREMGIEATPVLVATDLGPRLEQLLPSPLAFNHVVTRVQAPDGTVSWLDATRTHEAGPVAERQVMGLGHGLVVGGGDGLVALPSAADALHLEAEDTLLVGPFADAPELRARITFHGELSAHMRRRLTSAPAEELEKWLLGEYSRVYASARLLEPMRVEADDGHNRLRVVLRLALPGYWQFPEQRGLVGAYGFPLLMNTLRLPNQTPRQQPLQLSNVGVYRHSVQLRFDEDIAEKESSQRSDDGTAWFRLKVQGNGGRREQRIAAELRLVDNLLPAQQWAGHRDKLMQLWPQLGGTTFVSPLRPEQAAAVKTALRELQESVARGTIRVVTRQQAEARAKLLLLDAALDGGRLSPRLQAEARLQRGIQLDHLGRYEAARSDFEAALQARPDDAKVQEAWAVNALARGQAEVAVQALQKALALEPGDDMHHMTLARARYEQRDYAAADRELQALLAGSLSEPARGYALLWQHLATRRAGTGVTAPRPQPADLSGAGWPQPVLAALAGALSVEQATDAAREGKQPDPGRLCELFFFLGEQALIEGDLPRARRHFQRSVDTGVTEFVEHNLSQRRLAELEH